VILVLDTSPVGFGVKEDLVTYDVASVPLLRRVGPVTCYSVDLSTDGPKDFFLSESLSTALLP
jgi:hypothetical protein